MIQSRYDQPMSAEGKSWWTKPIRQSVAESRAAKTGETIDPEQFRHQSFAELKHEKEVQLQPLFERMNERAAAAEARKAARKTARRGAPDQMEQLRKLAELHDAGALTDEEFASKKADILSRI